MVQKTDTAEEATVQKNESSSATLVGKNTMEHGQPRIVSSSSYVQDQRQKELKMPNRFCTFDTMCEDDAVYNAIDVTNILVSLALFNGEFVSKGSRKSETAAEFLNYCIRNLSHGSWMEAVNNAVTDLKYGFSLLNIVTEKRNRGQYKGSYVLKKLSPRSQHSIAAWVWDKDNREVVGVLQEPMVKQTKKLKPINGKVNTNTVSQYTDTGYTYIKASQLMHFKYNATNNNPQGDSPLMHCYNAWKEKELIEKYEVIGVSKDMGGALIVKVPAELIEKANDPNTYPNEAAAYKELQKDAAALHAGESSYVVLQSDVDDVTKKPFYDIEFKGIDGGGKQYKTSDIIDQKRKSIYNVFGAGFLLLGQDTVGSYNLASSATSTHAFYVERNVSQKVEVINKLAQTLLMVNDISLNWSDMPEFRPADPQKADLDVISKVVQRMKSVGGLTRESLEHLYKEMGWPIEGLDELDFTDKGSSRAGESDGTSGTGNTQDGGIASTTNAENGGVEKSLVKDWEDDEFIYCFNDKGETVTIKKQE